MSRHWSINGRFLTQPLSGVQRYAREIVRQLDILLGEKHPATKNLSLEILTPPGAENFADLKTIGTRVVGRRGGHLWEQLDLVRHVNQHPSGGLLSLCNSGPVRLKKQIVCIHDANTRVYPQSYSLIFRQLYGVLHPLLGKRAARIVTVSQHSASQLVHYGIAASDKILVMSNGHEHALRWTPRHGRKTAELAGGDTIVAIGSPAPHKNMQLLVAIAGDLQAAGLQLAIVGVRDSRVFSPKDEAEGAGNISWLGHLPDNEIAALLQDALCLAFPSKAEGFGIPAVEAMVCNCPVISSNQTSLPEICGKAALYASPDEPQLWLEQILRLAGDDSLRSELIALGQEQCRKFSWRNSAIAYLQAMNEIDARDG